MKKTLFFLLAAIFLIPVVAYFWIFHGGLSDKHGTWGEFGSYLSGVYGSLALLIVTYTAYLTREQFRRQNEDTIFFRLFDSIQNRVESSSVEVDGKTISGHQCLKHIVDRFYEELSIEAIKLARLILVRAPETVDDNQYLKLFRAMGYQNIFENLSEDRSKFIVAIQSEKNFNDRWEKLKFYIGSQGFESEDVRDALYSLGSVSFYKVPFKDREHLYSAALQRIVEDHGELLDGYLSTLLLVFDLACNATNRTVYEKYIQSQLTRYEIIIIFYMLIGQYISISNQESVRKIGVMKRLHTFDCQALMIDMPSRDEIDTELNYLFSR